VIKEHDSLIATQRVDIDLTRKVCEELVDHTDAVKKWAALTNLHLVAFQPM